MTETELLNYIIKYYGAERQIEMIIEECSELIQALQKRKRANTIEEIEAALFNVSEELADVDIMIKQAKLIFNKSDIESFKNNKLLRLWDKINVNKKDCILIIENE